MSHDYIPFAYGCTNHYQGNYYAGQSSVLVTQGDGVVQPAVATQSTEAVPIICLYVVALAYIFVDNIWRSLPQGL